MPNPSQLALQPVALAGVNPPGYTAADLRRLALAGQAQEGAINAGDFKVTQRAAGAGLAVDVAAGEALVQGDSVAGQGLYYQLLGAALTGATEVTVPAGDATLPRIDQVVLEVKDTAHDGSGLNLTRVRLVAGTPTAGATLDNRLGVAALPPNAMLLADLLMPAAGVQALTANIRDRRPWARGAYRRLVRNANAGGGNDYSTTSSSFTDVDAVNLKPRLECSGGPVEISMRVEIAHTGGLGQFIFAPAVDSSLTDSVGGTGDPFSSDGSGVAGRENWRMWAWDLLPGQGSHLIGPRWRVQTAGTLTLFARGNTPLQIVIRELLRQNADNG